jgi:hypothetical protein
MVPSITYEKVSSWFLFDVATCRWFGFTYVFVMRNFASYFQMVVAMLLEPGTSGRMQVLGLVKLSYQDPVVSIGELERLR